MVGRRLQWCCWVGSLYETFGKFKSGELSFTDEAGKADTVAIRAANDAVYLFADELDSPVVSKHGVIDDDSIGTFHRHGLDTLKMVTFVGRRRVEDGQLVWRCTAGQKAKPPPRAGRRDRDHEMINVPHCGHRVGGPDRFNFINYQPLSATSQEYDHWEESRESDPFGASEHQYKFSMRTTEVGGFVDPKRLATAGELRKTRTKTALRDFNRHSIGVDPSDDNYQVVQALSELDESDKLMFGASPVCDPVLGGGRGNKDLLYECSFVPPDQAVMFNSEHQLVKAMVAAGVNLPMDTPLNCYVCLNMVRLLVLYLCQQIGVLSELHVHYVHVRIGKLECTLNEH